MSFRILKPSCCIANPMEKMTWCGGFDLLDLGGIAIDLNRTVFAEFKMRRNNRRGVSHVIVSRFWRLPPVQWFWFARRFRFRHAGSIDQISPSDQGGRFNFFYSPVKGSVPGL